MALTIPTPAEARTTRQKTWRDRRNASMSVRGRPDRAPPRIAIPTMSDSNEIAAIARAAIDRPGPSSR